MNDKTILESQQAAKMLTLLVLRKADKVFPRMRRAMEEEYSLTHGTLGVV